MAFASRTGLSQTVYKRVPHSEDEDIPLVLESSDTEDDTLYEISDKVKDKTNDRGHQPVYTVEEAVEAIGFGWFQIRLYVVCGVISATDALEMMLLAVMSPVVRCEWSLTDAEVALVTTVVFVGMGLSAPLLGYIGDKYGRKFTLMLVTLCIGYFGLLTSLSPTYYWVLILRGLVGVGMGGSPQGTSLLSEYIPRKYRAKTLIFGQVFWATGIMFEIFLAAVIIPTIGWRWLLVFSAVPSLLSAMGLLFVPESARFLLAAGKRDEAISLLEKAARVNKSRLPDGQLVRSAEVERGKFSNLFSPEYKRTTLQLWVLWFTMAFFYYGMVLASAEILRKYSPDGNKGQKCHCNFLTGKDYTTMLLSTMGEFICLPVNMVLIDWLGRRKNAAFNLFMAAILVLIIQLDMPRSVFTIVLFCIRGFSAAFGNLLYIYSSEIYPTTIRTLGMGTASAWARVGAMTTPFIAQVLLSRSLSLACWIYAVVCFLCSLCAYFMPIETKERALPQSVSMEMIALKTMDEEDGKSEEEMD
ncbi:putative transporter SVOPL [Aplysia californica]|uniref:Transporter SVOPL n=1 Tax=Aplysia californica TaxID=6500 RepID=A0ABM1W4D0_APLCA|nr:putative transporter SVOPL [Aplysia californica]